MGWLERHDRAIQRVFVGLFIVMAAAPIVLFLFQIGVIPTYSEYCHQNEYTKAKECATYYSVYVWWFHIGQFLTHEHGFLTALFTAVLALFTWRLWWSTHKLWEEAKAAGQTTRLQVRVAIAEKVPFVGWQQVKLAEFDEAGVAIPGRDPVLGGLVPPKWKPVFVFQNAGPTRIFMEFYGWKTEVTETLSDEPHFGGMFHHPRLVRADEAYAFAPGEVVTLSAEQMKLIDESDKPMLWAYGFLIYRDFLKTAHQIGVIAKWTRDRGFIIVNRPNYSYYRAERSYDE